MWSNSTVLAKDQWTYAGQWFDLTVQPAIDTTQRVRVTQVRDSTAWLQFQGEWSLARSTPAVPCLPCRILPRPRFMRQPESTGYHVMSKRATGFVSFRLRSFTQLALACMTPHHYTFRTAFALNGLRCPAVCYLSALSLLLVPSCLIPAAWLLCVLVVLVLPAFPLFVIPANVVVRCRAGWLQPAA